MVQQVLESNHSISQRLANTELNSGTYALSTAPSTTRANTTVFRGTPAPSMIRDDESLITIRNNGPDFPNDAQKKIPPLFGFVFDQDLANSRPYSRALKRRSMWSLNSSAVQTMGWSHLSGLSLANVSQISVINLPICPRDLWNGQQYSHQVKSESNITSGRGPDRVLLVGRFDLGINLTLRQYHLADFDLPAGTSLAGVSTVYNHLQILCGVGFTDVDRSELRDWILYDIINAFKLARPYLVSLGYLETVELEVC